MFIFQLNLGPHHLSPVAAAWKTEIQTFNLTNLHENVRFSMVCFGDNDIGILHCEHRKSWFSAHFIFAAVTYWHSAAKTKANILPLRINFSSTFDLGSGLTFSEREISA